MNLITKIDEYLIELKDKNLYDNKNEHHPSGVLSCNRQIFYKWCNIPKTDIETPGNLLKMKMGDIIHEWVYTALKSKGLKLIIENEDNDGNGKEIFDCRLKYPFKFKTDARFVDEHNIASIIEVKSSFGRGVKDIQLNGPKDTMIAQVVLYMKFENVNRAYFIFIGRDNGYRTQHVVDLLPEGGFIVDGRKPIKCNERYNMIIEGKKYPITYTNIIKKLVVFEGYYEKNIIPPRDYMVAIKNGEIKEFIHQKVKYKPDWQCSYCQWKTHCWQEELKIYSSSNNSEMFGGVI